MKERPILFSAPMVRAIPAGTKTQTRRTIKRQPWRSCCIEEGMPGEPPFVYSALHGDGPGYDVEESRTPCRCPYGQPGDRLWVRETWAPRDRVTLLNRQREEVFYRADDERRYDTDGKWRPSIHMPRWASRLTLEITGVRAERLQAISEEDARAEGVKAIPGMSWHSFAEASAGIPMHEHTAIDAYAALWESINGAGSWDANPWVWVIEFRRVTP